MLQYRPGFYALKQLAEQLGDVTTITRSSAAVTTLPAGKSTGTVWVGWVHPDVLVLPGIEPTKLNAAVGSATTNGRTGSISNTPYLVAERQPWS